MCMRVPGWIMLALGLWGALVTGPAVAATVTVVTPPVWLEREGERAALMPGTSLTPDDVVVTGQDAAAYLEPGDGSGIDVGPESAIGMAAEAPLRFVLSRGMVRYAAPVGGFTEPLELLAGRLQVVLNSGELLAGMRAGAGELLLVAGEVRIAAPQVGLPGKRYSEPRSWYRLDNGDLEQGRLDEEVVGRRVAALRSDRQAITLHADGPWIANLISLRDEAAASAIVDELVAEGYPVHLSPTRVQGREWYRVQLRGFASEAPARELGNRLAGRYGGGRAWIYESD